MIRAGKRCYMCRTYLGTPPTPGERACLKCDPTIYRIVCHVSSDWVLCFTESGPQTAIGPWLLCEDRAEVDKILRWGKVTPEDMADFANAMAMEYALRSGRGGCEMMLTDEQYKRLSG